MSPNERTGQGPPPSPLPLRRVGQHPHVAARDFQPAAAEGQRPAVAFHCVAQLAFPQLREQRRVARSRTNRLSGVATSSRNVSAMALPQRLQLLGAFEHIFDGISLNPRLVSASLTYLPGCPVNCSATWKG